MNELLHCPLKKTIRVLVCSTADVQKEHNLAERFR